MSHAHVISWMNVDYDSSDAYHNPDDSLFDYRILAEGDSWFTLAGIPTSNLLFSLEFPSDTVLVSCGRPGDTIRNMAQIASNVDLRHAMNRRFGSQWDAILLSGGGNDLIDDADEILTRHTAKKKDPADYCNHEALSWTLDSIRQGFRRIAEMRDKADSSCRDVPIITHTYDFVTPRNSPAKFLGMPVVGPWLYIALKEEKIPPEKWIAISDYLMGTLSDTIKSLATGPDRIPNFHVVNTLGTLVRADMDRNVESNDWLNEIHPSSGGYRKLAKKISRKLQRVLASETV